MVGVDSEAQRVGSSRRISRSMFLTSFLDDGSLGVLFLRFRGLPRLSS